MRMSLLVWVLFGLGAVAGPVEIPQLGFSVAVQADGPVVVQVTPGSVADQAGVKPGLRLTTVHQPRSRQLARASLEQVVAALSVPPQEEVIFAGLADGQRKTFVLKNEAPLPEPEFPVVPLPPAEVAKLTPRQQMRYVQVLARSTPRPQPPPLPGSASAELAEDTVATFTAAPRPKLVSVMFGSIGPKWISADVRITYRCSGGAAEALEVRSPSSKVALQIPLSDSARQGTETRRLDLWRVDQAAKACRTGGVNSVALQVSVKCADGSTQQARLEPSPLEVRCDGQTTPLSQRTPTVNDSELVAGTPGSVGAEFRLRTVSPTPARLTPVLLDAKGAIASRFEPVYTRPEDAPGHVSVSIPIDTTESGTLRLAFEAEYADGSRAVTKPAEVRVRTPEQKAQLDRAWAKGSKAFFDFTKKLEASGHGCHDLKAHLAWLRAQPEILRADKTPGGLSWMLKKHPVPAIVHCH